MLDYESIKSMAKELGCPPPDLLAMPQTNDPFYAGTRTGREHAEWFAEIWRAGGFYRGAHLRRLHYWCVSSATMLRPNGKPYENTEECWKYLCEAGLDARGTID